MHTDRIHRCLQLLWSSTHTHTVGKKTHPSHAPRVSWIGVTPPFTYIVVWSNDFPLYKSDRLWRRRNLTPCCLISASTKWISMYSRSHRCSKTDRSRKANNTHDHAKQQKINILSNTKLDHKSLNQRRDRMRKPHTNHVNKTKAQARKQNTPTWVPGWYLQTAFAHHDGCRAGLSCLVSSFTTCTEWYTRFNRLKPTGLSPNQHGMYGVCPSRLLLRPPAERVQASSVSVAPSPQSNQY